MVEKNSGKTSVIILFISIFDETTGTKKNGLDWSENDKRKKNQS